MRDLIERLRALSRHEHSDYSIGDEAADALEAVRKDAERYRWLRDPCSGAERVIFYCRGDYGKGLMCGAMLDAAIDEAMGKEEK